MILEVGFEEHCEVQKWGFGWRPKKIWLEPDTRYWGLFTHHLLYTFFFGNDFFRNILSSKIWHGKVCHTQFRSYHVNFLNPVGIFRRWCNFGLLQGQVKSRHFSWNNWLETKLENLFGFWFFGFIYLLNGIGLDLHMYNRVGYKKYLTYLPLLTTLTFGLSHTTHYSTKGN